MRDILSGKYVTGVFKIANLTSIEWYYKKQAAFYTTTYGAEFQAARTCIEQVLDLQNSFHYLGTPVFEISYVWGDNKTHIMSSTVYTSV